MSVNKRIKKFLDDNKIKVTAFAERTGITHTTISSIINTPDGSPRQKTIDMILSAYPQIDRDWLLFDDGIDGKSSGFDHMVSATEKALKYRISLKENRKPVPMYNVKAAAGTIALVQDEHELIVEYLDVPFVGMVDGAIEVVGESMLPTLCPGARAAVKKLEDKTLLNWGEVYYVIDANYEGYVKRLYPGSDDTFITLKSDNPNAGLYPPIARKWEHIVAIFKVKADITKH